MGFDTGISWTHFTWNVAQGCHKKSEGCKYCYMMRDADKYGKDGNTVTRTKSVFYLPLKLQRRRKKLEDMIKGGAPVSDIIINEYNELKQKRLCFVSSLTDILIEEIDPYRGEAFDIMLETPEYIYQILTKRPERWVEAWERYLNIVSLLPVPKNIWLGATAENQERLEERISHLKYSGVRTTFLSIEPILGPVDLSACDKIDYKPDWIIIGGESGNDNGKWLYRPAELKWFFDIVDYCRAKQIPVFVKQLGTHIAQELKAQGHLKIMTDRHGAEYYNLPFELQVRQFPQAYYKYFNL